MACLKLPGKHPRLVPYSAVKQVGKGSYGEVFLVKHAREKKQFVMKNIKLTSSSAKERLAAEQEASLLSQLQHPNIVGYKESFQDEFGVLHIVMAYCEGGDLCTRLKTYHGQLLPEPQVVEWFVQIALALQYLHERNILHRDLKTQNIFLSKNDIIKVGDLGIARVLDGSCDLAHTVIGTPYYMSPELFANQPYNHKSDIWALGCCVYEMATLKHAFTARNINALMYKIVQGKLPPLPGQFSADLSSLVQRMLSRNTDDRPAVHDILRMEFIRYHIKQFLQRAAGRKRKNHKPPAASRTTISSSQGTPVDQEPQTRDARAPPPDALRRRRSSSGCSEGSNKPSSPATQSKQHRGPTTQQRRSSSSATSLPQRSKQGDSAESSPEMHGKERSKKKPPRPLPPDPVSSKSEEGKSKHKNNPPPCSPSAVVVSSARERRRRSKQLQEGGGRGRVVLRSRSSSDLSKKEDSSARDKEQTLTQHTAANGEDCTDGPVKNEKLVEPTVTETQQTMPVVNESNPPQLNSDIPPQHSKGESNGSTEIKANGANDGHSSDEVDEFYTLLDTTLHLPELSPRQLQPEEAIAPPKVAFMEEKTVDHAAMPSGRLGDRIKALRMECESGLDSSTFQEAYQLLDQVDPEEAEEMLVKLLGEEQFVKFGAKLQQLKLCEESFFEL